MADTRVIEIVNRTTSPLNFISDGVPGTVRPGYKRVTGDDGKPLIVPAGRDGQVATEHITSVRAEHARRQNPLLGSEDRWGANDLEYLIAFVERDEESGQVRLMEGVPANDMSYCEQSKTLERFNRKSMGEADAAAVTVAASGFPRGRTGAAFEATHYDNGPGVTKD